MGRRFRLEAFRVIILLRPRLELCFSNLPESPGEGGKRGWGWVQGWGQGRGLLKTPLPTLFSRPITSESGGMGWGEPKYQLFKKTM